MQPTLVTTRFAPSPTGYLHVGGARTALFNWAFARRHGGKFILRLEDTDRKRSTDAAAAQIFEDLHWLGIDWDEGPDPSLGDHQSSYLDSQKGNAGPYCQSQRLDIYDQYVQKLIDSGFAYESDDVIEGTLGDSGRRVVRFKAPKHEVTVQDLVLGNVTFQPAELEDFVIRKSDGYATYHLAVVVDDFLMGVTHVFRAQEHLTNTPKHIALQQALGFTHPAYAHFPLIFNPDGKKMSKREKPRTARASGLAWGKDHGGNGALADLCGLSADSIDEFLSGKSDNLEVAERVAERLNVKLPEIDVHDFRRSGYLPEVLCNYLSLLGWSPGGDVEHFDKSFLATHFDVSRVGKSSARFDRKKLLRFNADALHQMSTEQFRTLLHQYGAEFYPEFMAVLDGTRFDRFSDVYHKRSRTLADPFVSGKFLSVPDRKLEFQPGPVAECLVASNGLAMLRATLPVFKALPEFVALQIESVLHDSCRDLGLSLNVVTQALRVALTGGKVSPSIGETCELLGKESVLARIEQCLEKCAT
jgi:glutamyl/glutaminyl-tRNA synthetase